MAMDDGWLAESLAFLQFLQQAERLGGHQLARLDLGPTQFLTLHTQTAYGSLSARQGEIRIQQLELRGLAVLLFLQATTSVQLRMETRFGLLQEGQGHFQHLQVEQRRGRRGLRNSAQTLFTTLPMQIHSG
jgi:hypothetical protein